MVSSILNITGKRSIDIMIQLSPLILLPIITYLFQSVMTLKVDEEYNRPQFHLTPEKGWMNDPNGLWYDRKDKIWHAYYQHLPNQTTHGPVINWGHSTSKDLMKWDVHDDALFPDNKTGHGIFSGAVVIDRNNTSGFFNDSLDPEHRIVALYTLNTPTSETQELAYSLDGGYSFIKYDKNPVIDVDTPQQRDPKVLWHEETQKWVMLVAKTQEYKVEFWSSSNLKEWELISNFTGGVLGFQYECPGLFKLPIENAKEDGPDSKWVLILAINPGSPIGGSFNQYFIGDFDGKTFTPDDHATRIQDFGKDYYAFQAFDNTEPEDGAIGIAWASNWQYANLVPTKKWRHSQSLARKHTLRYVDVNPETNQLALVQTPVFETKETKADPSLKSWDVINEYDLEDTVLTSETLVGSDFNSERNSSGVLDFNLTFTVAPNATYGLNFGINIDSQIVEGTKETIQVVFDAQQTTWFIDRTTQHNFQRKIPYFQERLSLYHQFASSDAEKGNTYHVYGIVDRNILELYFNNGEITSTNTFFFSQNKIPSSISIATDTDEEIFTLDSLVIRELGLK
ncbi:Invertase [Wickerhamomyces ciferrii]|uniref:Invertase n=1 Tax=Wickerhamomyces ciferrii (strain ATCC 14091 / BCRC 22168 / CBS 111 / JCM 3599 / NBRC 0793 / NRRL Y-1031 F-60-10) TaxID=1206466 RepID=K0KK55_WICCF|nr:Invertase [Wickerhamomyces ciferrii]CCH43296.1 Invertase [Wickerhamomyces ciferrii]